MELGKPVLRAREMSPALVRQDNFFTDPELLIGMLAWSEILWELVQTAGRGFIQAKPCPASYVDTI